MRWEYQVVAKNDLEEFMMWFNDLGEEGWEAISGNYTTGKPYSERQPGGYPMMRPSKPQWVALMKRAKP